MTDSFVFYRSYFEAISDLTDTNQLLLYQAIANYSLNDIEPNFKGTIGTLFKLIKPQIDSNKKRREDGTKGGRPPKKEKETSGLEEKKPVVIETENHSFEENKPNVNGNGDVNANGNKNEDKKKRFTPPLLFEVVEYFIENGYSEQAATKAFKYYDVANWKDSNDKQVKNWKQKMQSVWFKDENKAKAEVKADGTDQNFISPNGLKGIFTLEKKTEKLWFRRYPHLRQYELTVDGGMTWDKRDVL